MAHLNQHVLLARLRSVQLDLATIQTTNKIDEAKIAAVRIDGVVKHLLGVLQYNEHAPKVVAMNTAKLFVPPPSIKLCECVHPDSLKCLAIRYNEKDTHFARCMGGCPCKCHKNERGGDIERSVWSERRQKLVEVRS